MENLAALVPALALMLCASWASGLNLYAVLFVLGLGSATEQLVLPQGLQILQSPLIIFAAAAFYCIEFFTDKMPNVDVGWDALHTFIRIPGGALVAAGVVSSADTSIQLAAAFLGAFLAASCHASKFTVRALVNTKFKPFSTWAASICEDLLALGALWFAIYYPKIGVLIMFSFMPLAIWIVPQTLSALGKLISRVGLLFAGEAAPAASPSNDS